MHSVNVGRSDDCMQIHSQLNSKLTAHTQLLQRVEHQLDENQWNDQVTAEQV